MAEDSRARILEDTRANWQRIIELEYPEAEDTRAEDTRANCSSYFLSFSAFIACSLLSNENDASNVGQWNVLLQQGSDLCFLMSLVLNMFCLHSILKVVNLVRPILILQLGHWVLARGHTTGSEANNNEVSVSEYSSYCLGGGRGDESVVAAWF